MKPAPPVTRTRFGTGEPYLPAAGVVWRAAERVPGREDAHGDLRRLYLDDQERLAASADQLDGAVGVAEAADPPAVAHSDAPVERGDVGGRPVGSKDVETRRLAARGRIQIAHFEHVAGRIDLVRADRAPNCAGKCRYLLVERRLRAHHLRRRRARPREPRDEDREDG